MPMLSWEQLSMLRALRQGTDDARLVASSRVRVYRSILVIVTFVLLAAVVLLPAIIPHMARDLSVVRSPADVTSAADVTNARDIATIEVWGAVGALASVIVALHNLSSSRHPVKLQL